MGKKAVSILGVTGSIGQSATDVILSAPERFDVQIVTANQNVDALARAAIKLKARKAIINDESKVAQLAKILEYSNIEVGGGPQAVIDCAGEPADIVLVAIVGIAGLRPILKALSQGINVAIANKEPLVAAGPLVIEEARKHGSKILPVDSEHNAIFQVFENHNRDHIDKIILTASGGPFLNHSLEDIAKATPEQAIAHPNWSMGKKISVDSATMMNKALEIIEAHYLFDMPAEKIDVLIHPQSAVHSMVSYKDGSILAQMGASDMRTPIAYALSWPDRMESCGKKLDFSTMHTLNFEQPDFKKFPALTYAYECLKKGQPACIAMNAANEVAVGKFLEREIGFPDIMKSVRYALDYNGTEISSSALKTVDEIEEFDKTVRNVTIEYITKTRAA